MMKQTTTVVQDTGLMEAVNLRAQRRENNLALCALMYVQLLSMSALALLSTASTGAYLSAMMTAVPMIALYALAAKSAQKHGYRLPRALGGVFAALFFSDMVLCLLSLTELVCAYVLPHVPRTVIALSAAGLTGLGLAGRRHGGARRCASALCGFFLAALAVCLVFALPEGDAGHLYPLLGYGSEQIARGTAYLLGGVWSAGALPFFVSGVYPPPMKKPRPYLAPLVTVMLFAGLMLAYALLLPSPLLPGKWGFVLQLQLIMEMSPSILSWSLMLISRMLLFLSAFAVAGDSACECLHGALKKKKVPILPLVLLSVPLALLPLTKMENVLKMLLPLRYAISFFGVGISLLARKKEAAA